MSVTLNHSQLRDARDWLAENTWADMDSSDFGALTDVQIERGIAQHYAGGIAAFICAESDPQPEEETSVTHLCIRELIALSEASTESAERLCTDIGIDADSTNVLVKGETATDGQISRIRTAIRQTVASNLCDALSVSDLMYAGSPERGQYRGLAALGDLDDHNQLALNAGCPAPDGTDERLVSINLCCEAISAEIISRYVVAVRARAKKGVAK